MPNALIIALAHEPSRNPSAETNGTGSSGSGPTSPAR